MRLFIVAYSGCCHAQEMLTVLVWGRAEEDLGVQWTPFETTIKETFQQVLQLGEKAVST